MYKIFIIEDDEKLCSNIKEYIERFDYNVYKVKNFKNIEWEFQEINPDLILLDINLPYFDGFYLCRFFRKKSNVPIIIISARAEETEQIMGIELGADDYITKPVSLHILLTKIKAFLRRTHELQEGKQNFLKINDLYLNENNFKIKYKSKEKELSKNEFILLKKLVENEDKIVTREELLEALWDNTNFVDDNTLTVNVTRVRNRLKELGIQNAIETKWGTGYILNSKKV